MFGWTQGKNERESKHGNKKCLEGTKLPLSLISSGSENWVEIEVVDLCLDAYRKRTRENKSMGTKNLLSSP